MIDEIRKSAALLKVGDKLSPGILTKFETFRSWLMKELSAEQKREPCGTIEIGSDSNITDNRMYKTIRSDRYTALETLVVLVAKLPTLEPTERRARADEIVIACDAIDCDWIKVKLEHCEPDKSTMSRHAKDLAEPVRHYDGDYWIKKDSLQLYIKVNYIGLYQHFF